jgi:hypothetical protein
MQSTSTLDLTIPNEYSCCAKPDKSICQHFAYAMERMTDMYSNGNLCDIVLICNNKHIHAHRVILSSVSDYFYAMFNGNLAESKKSAVTMNGDIDGDALQSLVDFIYRGCIKNSKSD